MDFGKSEVASFSKKITDGLRLGRFGFYVQTGRLQRFFAGAGGAIRELEQ